MKVPEGYKGFSIGSKRFKAKGVNIHSLTNIPPLYILIISVTFIEQLE